MSPNHFLIGSKMKSWTIHVQMGNLEAIGSDVPNFVKHIPKVPKSVLRWEMTSNCLFHMNVKGNLSSYQHVSICLTTQLWTLTRSTGPARLAFKRKERRKSLCFPVLKNPPSVRNGVVWSHHLLFIFAFKMEKIK